MKSFFNLKLKVFINNFKKKLKNINTTKNLHFFSANPEVGYKKKVARFLVKNGTFLKRNLDLSLSTRSVLTAHSFLKKFNRVRYAFSFIPRSIIRECDTDALILKAVLLHNIYSSVSKRKRYGGALRLLTNKFRKPLQFKLKRPRFKQSYFTSIFMFRKVILANGLLYSKFKVTSFIIKNFKRQFFLNSADYAFINGYSHYMYDKFHIPNNYRVNLRRIKQKNLKWPRLYKSNKFWFYFSRLAKLKPKFFQHKITFDSQLRFILKRFRLRNFWFYKSIFRKFFLRHFQVKLSFFKVLKNSVKAKPTAGLFNSLENRLDFVLIKLGYFRTLNIARGAIEFGLVYLNFKKCVRVNVFVRDSDFLFVNFASVNKSTVLFFFWSFLFKEHYSVKYPILEKPFFDKYRSKPFFQKKFNFLKKYLILIKSFLGEPSRSIDLLNGVSSPKYYFNIIHFPYLHLSIYRRKLYLRVFTWKVLDILTHQKLY